MAHKCTYKDKILYDEKLKQFYRLVTAFWKDKKHEIAKVYEDGKVYARNLSCSYAGGYCVAFPGETVNYYGYEYVIENEDYIEILGKFNLWVNKSIVDKDYIISNDTSLKYLVSKYKNNRNDELLKLIAMYRKHPEIEPLVEIGQCSLALDKRLYRLSKKKKLEVINFVKNNLEDGESLNLSKVFKCLKYNIKYEHYNLFEKCKNDKVLFKYLIKQNQSHSFYEDYKKMAINAGHDFNDEYWKYPKSLSKAHDKVLEECKNIEKSIDGILNKQFEIVASKIKKQEQVIDGNHYYIVQDYSDFCNQAMSLMQCLITAGYMKKFIKQQSVLIFIKDSNLKPLGTVEINYKKEIIQAYGNESDRKKCLLPNEVLESVNQYINNIRISKHKFIYNLPKNCYFKGVYNENKSFNGIEFKVGEVYKTAYDDEVIIENGSECIASDKVYHFCKKIDDVNEWVHNLYSFAIVKPLGPVVQKGTAFGSNKIKIEKIATKEEIAKIMLSINKCVKETIK